jgi:hypothetical protein
MSRSSSAALVAALAVTVTSLGRAQQPAADTTAHRSKPSATSDERQDRRTIAVDSARLTHDIALRDSARARVEEVRGRFAGDEARIDSLKAKLARDQKAHDPAAVRKDEADLKQARNTYDQDLDRWKRDRAELATIEKRVDSQADAETAARKDLRSDRAGNVLAQDQARTRADEAKLDSLQKALIRARKTAPADTTAIQASIAQAKKTLESDKDRDQRQRSGQASPARSALEHPGVERATAKSHRR